RRASRTDLEEGVRASGEAAVADVFRRLSRPDSEAWEDRAGEQRDSADGDGDAARCQIAQEPDTEPEQVHVFPGEAEPGDEDQATAKDRELAEINERR